MKNIKFQHIVVVVVILGLCVFNFRLISFNNTLKSSLLKIQNDFQMSNIDHNDLIQYEELEDSLYFISLNYKLDSSFYLTNEKEAFNIKKLRNDNPDKLFLFYTKAHCTSCYIQHLDVLKKHIPKSNCDKLILISDKNSREIANFLRDNPNICNYYFLKEDEKRPQFPCEALGSPFLFKLNKDLEIEDLFFLQKSDPLIFERYLSNLL